jgi:hypothetical protein
MDDDQYEQEHAAEYQADDDALEVLAAVASSLQDTKHLVLVGPFDDERVCEVQFTDAEDAARYSLGPIKVDVRGEVRDIEVRTIVRSPLVRFSSVMTASPGTLPIPPTGRPMGGDPIWQVAQSDHGTAAFFARSLVVSPTAHSKSKPAPVFNDAVLSCNHVLAGLGNAPLGSPVSMVNRPNQLTLAHKAPAPLDAACATVATPGDYLYSQIRALGHIAGVRRPHRRMRVHKYGARTGLTTGLIARVFLATIGGLILKVFEIGGRFACVHDSGAAVVSDRREFVGLVFRGSSSACDLDTVTYVMAAAPYRVARANETFFVEYS